MLFQKPTYDWLIAGLGNPGPEYEKTRHNTGFMSLDLLAARLQVKVSKERFKALTAQADFDGQRLLLMKPQTFMNASGIAIEAAAHFYKIPPERVLVLFDDMVDTAGSLCNAAKAIVEIGGATEVYACATHGVLSGPANERIANSCIKELTFLNTIPPLEGACSKIKYLDVSPIFADAIQRIYEENSMSVLF